MSERDRQRNRLATLLAGDVDGNVTELANYLLDNGVSVELPVEPEVKQGDTGTATVRGVEGVRVMAFDGTNGLSWWSAEYIESSRLHYDEVTDFVPDPEPLTAEAVEASAEAVTIATHGARTVLDARDFALRALRESLAPYVAKGGE